VTWGGLLIAIDGVVDVGSEPSRIGSGPFLRTLATVVISLSHQLASEPGCRLAHRSPDHCIGLMAAVSCAGSERPALIAGKTAGWSINAGAIPIAECWVHAEAQRSEVRECPVGCQRDHLASPEHR